MKVAGTRDHGEEEEETNSRVDGNAGGLVKDRLAEGAENGETVANKVELGNLVSVRRIDSS